MMTHRMVNTLLFVFITQIMNNIVIDFIETPIYPKKKHKLLYNK